VKMQGQRWVYRLGNSVVCIDNGFSWLGWTQERMVVNDETVQQSDGWFRYRQDFFEPWIIPGGEGVLRVKLVAALLTVNCSASLDDRELQPSETRRADWSGAQGTWPADDGWTLIEA